MKVSHHAAIRFLERIMNLKEYTSEQVKRAIAFLEKDTDNIEFFNKQRVILPSFPHFEVIQRENMIITIIPKSRA